MRITQHHSFLFADLICDDRRTGLVGVLMDMFLAILHTTQSLVEPCAFSICHMSWSLHSNWYIIYYCL